MLTPKEKSLPETFSPEQDGTHDAASSRTASPTHFTRKQNLLWPVTLNLSISLNKMSYVDKTSCLAEG